MECWDPNKDDQSIDQKNFFAKKDKENPGWFKKLYLEISKRHRKSLDKLAE